MPPPSMSNPSPSFSTNPVPALIARRTTVLAPPSLSTVNHLDGVPSSSSSTASRPTHPSTRRHRSDLQQAVSLPTAAHPVSTRENISTSKTWSSGLALKHSQTPYQNGPRGGFGGDEGFAVHPTFRSDAENRGDVLVRVDAVEFWVHKDVLLFSSPFFKSVLGGEWKESRLSTLLHAEAEDAEASQDIEVEGVAVEQQDRVNLNPNESNNQEAATKADTSLPGIAAVPTEPSLGGPDDHHSGDSRPTLVTDLVEDNSLDQEREDVAESELDSEHLDVGEARRRSLLRASYHTALWSQDDERGTSPTLSQCAAAFPDAAEEDTLSTNDNDVHSAEEEGTLSEDEFQDEDSDQDAADSNVAQEEVLANQTTQAVDSTAVAAQHEPSTKSSPQRQRSGSSGLKQVRSKSKHLAARLTLRKLESAQREKRIPTRSTSKGAGLGLMSDPVTEPDAAAAGPLERLESLATPPVSRRPSQEALCSLPTSDVTLKPSNETNRNPSIPPTPPPPPPPPPPSRKTTSLPQRYKGIISIIDLAEESASTFHDFLFHAYPHLDLSVTWFNCGPLLRFSDKFQVPFLRRSCVTFLRAALAGRPIEAMRLAELHGMDDLYKEASRHVLDNFSAWTPDELEVLSKETLLKLERKRTWFLERLLKLGLANPGRDYECHPTCPDPSGCARGLHEKWQAAYANAFRFSPPQPSAIFRHLREIDSTTTNNNVAQLSSCQAASRIWVQGLFDRMFELGTLHSSGRLFLAVKLDGVVPRNVSYKE
ncbi:uncharacterized protein UTRI_04960_B [Ustilago trichophora]|uniref:BTB domain-containing protein n=1 Tax=Ustilago trichophora TaxID=86804 RepID=A0A5C3EEQ2_9BASI|nr:uncharacterized protein UTRI_04960_B [Ustilago trichophora]